MDVFVLIALASAAPAEVLPNPQGPIYTNPALLMAFFEFAPQSGAGMGGAACACATPTGAKGEAMTFTRASSGTCLKGPTVAGIANGDMVTCATNQARVMPGGDGSGGLGLLVEGARTNDALRSQELDNAAWSTSGSAMTITADQAVVPDGTTTAERLQIPSVIADTGESVRYQLVASGTRSASFFVKGNASSGTIDVAAAVGGGGCISCSFNASTWTRCVAANIAGSNIIEIGNQSITAVNCPSGHGAKGSLDVFVTDAQSEVGAYASSYIATAGSTVTRATELADLPVTFGAGTTGFSLSSTVVLPNSFANQPILGAMIGDGALGGAGSTNYLLAQANGSAVVLAGTAGAGTPTGYTSALTALINLHRYAVFHTGALLSVCMDGVCGAGAGGTYSAPTLTRLRIGNYSGTLNIADGVTKQVCLDPSPTRCR